MKLKTGLCERFGITHPIVQAPMAGGWTTSELAIAVSNAGGLGNLAAARVTIDGLRAAITTVTAGTRRPFGVSFLVAPPEPMPANVPPILDVLDQVPAELGLPPGPREVQAPSSVIEEWVVRDR